MVVLVYIFNELWTWVNELHSLASNKKQRLCFFARFKSWFKFHSNISDQTHIYKLIKKNKIKQTYQLIHSPILSAVCQEMNPISIQSNA